MNILKNVFGGQKKIEKLIADLTYVSPQMASLREARSKLDDELVLAYVKYHEYPMELMLKENALSNSTLKVEESDGKIRIKAAQDLAASKSPEALPALINTMEVNYPPVRVGAAIALGKLGNPSAADALEKIISKEDVPQELKNAAQGALKTIRSLKVG